MGFVIGTVGDVVTSYFYIVGIDNYKLGISAVVFAFGWLLCSFIYMAISTYDHIQYKKYFLEIQDEENLGKRKLPDIPLTIGNNNNNNSVGGGGGGFVNSTIGRDREKTCSGTFGSESDDSLGSSPKESSINSMAEEEEVGVEGKKDCGDGSDNHAQQNLFVEETIRN